MGTFVVAVLVFGCVALICRRMWRQHKMAKLTDGAGCGCGGCSGCLSQRDSGQK